MKHVTVYSEPNVFAAWPANGGIWSWGNEILVGFQTATWAPGGDRHSHVIGEPLERVQSRSMDGGETWITEDFKCRTGRDVVSKSNEGFALRFGMQSFHGGPSAYVVSGDRGRTWSDWNHIQQIGRGTAARTSYLKVRSKILVFLTRAKQSGNEGVPMVCEMKDGDIINPVDIVEEPKFQEGFAIMPFAVHLSGDTLIAAVRRSDGQGKCSITIHESRDLGQTWNFLSKPYEGQGKGNPGHLCLTKDGAICLTFGYRHGPFGVDALISRDGGLTWPENHKLAIGYDWDLGYPQTVCRPDGNMVTVYYVNRPNQQRSNIEATIWTP